MTLGAITEVLVGVSQLDAALALFRDTLGLEIVTRHQASVALTNFWGLGAPCDLVTLSCGDHPYGRLVLADLGQSARIKVRVHDGPGPHDGPADIGPKAIDFYVADPIRPIYERILALGYRARSSPVLHDVGDTQSEEFVFWGPDGVPLLLMVGHRHGPAFQRGVLSPQGFSEVATISIVGADVAASRTFYADVLGMTLIQDARTEPASLSGANALTGTAQGTPIHWLVYGGADEASGKILVIHFPGAPAQRLTGRMRPGHLGFSLMRHVSDDFDGLTQRLTRAGALHTAPRVVDGERRLLALGPNEELFDIAEARV